jgi:hypothetical protein
MGALLLDKNLRDAPPDSEVRILAQAQPYTVLPTLNAARKRSIVVFLHNSMLVQESEPIISLRGADLPRVPLSLDRGVYW